MSEKWYPVIDTATCIECGTCVNFCPHLVYDKQKAPVPVVVNPNACIDNCRNCQKQCPSGAISYFGDTKSTPAAVPSCGCCETEAPQPKTEGGEALKSVKVLGAGCSSCHEQLKNAKEAVKALGLELEVEYVGDLQKIAGYGVMRLPAIVINERPVSIGKILKPEEVQKLLRQYEI